MFNSSLFRVDLIDVTSYTPYSIALLNGELLVGLENGIIRINNKIMTQTVSNICPNTNYEIYSILIYQNQYTG